MNLKAPNYLKSTENEKMGGDNKAEILTSALTGKWSWGN